MTPATHVVAGAAAAARFRNAGAALAAAFLLHFFLDAVYHFEAFYELSVPAQWSYSYTMFMLFGGLLLLGAPVFVHLARHDPAVSSFGCYALLMCALAFEPKWDWKLFWGAMLSAFWLLITRAPEPRKWILCGFVSYLPDCLKKPIPLLARLHDAAHYRSDLDLGDWVSLLGRGRWRIPVNDRIFDPYYQAGYVLEILLEAVILFGCLYWLSRGRAAATDHPAGRQSDAIAEGSLIRK
ncbi:MAG TPA: hypothetical protein VFA54_11180 [Bryobacterales bacterium]|jgi:hypothetical protein|nr:hypothetical protein [Bryobacterales bacterium]